jgi:predicted RNA-binding protein with TRAM domain
VGETYEVSIESVGGKGDGVAKVKGFVLFVPNVKKGDYVKVKVTKVMPSVGFAEVVEKLETPPQQSNNEKYVSVNQEELNEEKEPEDHYEDSEDFGEEKSNEEEI